MKNIALIDSGPLIALFDKSDKFHTKVLEFLKHYEGELITSWAVVTEVTHMLDFNLNVQIDFLKWVELGAVKIYDIKQNELNSMITMIQKYTNVPMDFADSSLMYIAHKENIKNIVSIDSDFDIYRTLKNGYLLNLLR
jgi:predicted nucleic acid-binding protein